jgi:hypothetical protein
MTISELQMLIDLADKFQAEYYPREKIREQGTDVYDATDIVSKAASDEIEKAKGL